MLPGAGNNFVTNYSQITEELTKLYSQVKIPVAEHAGYYLNTLFQSPEYADLNKWVFEVAEFYNATNGETYKAKMAFLDKFKKHFEDKGYLAALNAIELPNYKGFTSDFKPQTAHTYVAVDMRAANFNICKLYLGLTYKDWDAMIDAIDSDLPAALRNSKSFRQVLFGNVNPKRQQGLQARLMVGYVEQLQAQGFTVVSAGNEEMFIAANGDGRVAEVIAALDAIDWATPMKYTVFTVQKEQHFGDHVRIDHVYEEGTTDINAVTPIYTRLKAVNGNRFYMHFKPLILGDTDILEEDLLFKNDGKYAKWVIDLKEDEAGYADLPDEQ